MTQIASVGTGQTTFATDALNLGASALALGVRDTTAVDSLGSIRISVTIGELRVKRSLRSGTGDWVIGAEDWEDFSDPLIIFNPQFLIFNFLISSDCFLLSLDELRLIEVWLHLHPN